jgi:Arc/MetJ-type ribon-helix-helix transcriptional regulator
MKSLIYKIVISIFLIGSVVGAGVGYVKYTNDIIQDLNTSLVKYKSASEQCKSTLKLLEKSEKDQAKDLTNLGKNLVSAQSYNDKLRAKLGRHNLTYLAAKKPVLIEKRINDATKKVFKDITDTTTY